MNSYRCEYIRGLVAFLISMRRVNVVRSKLMAVSMLLNTQTYLNELQTLLPLNG